MENKIKILVVGGGFGGIRTALDVARRCPEAIVTLVSDKNHFEYYPRLYRVVTGKTPLEVCVPLDEIFKNTEVRVVIDRILSIKKEENIAVGESGSNYHYDFLVLALGSETTYFGVPGLKELSFGFKSINEALRLKNRLHQIIANHKVASLEEMRANLHIVIVGGGSSGVELAGELTVFMKEICKVHNLSYGLVTIDLLEGSPRILPQMPEDVSIRVAKNLTDSGVKIHTSKTVLMAEEDKLVLKDEQPMRANTIIWTAGAMPNHLYKEFGFEYDKKGRVVVDSSLLAMGSKNIFVIGDGASTPFSGLAQTAITDGDFVAKVIDRKIIGKRIPRYKPEKVAYLIPAGKNFAVFIWGSFRLYGIIPWFMRLLVDIKYFISILPVFKALIAFDPSSKLCVSCDSCLHHEKE